MKSTDPRIDAYIAKSAPFARPILTKLRAAVHEACPEAEETIKWRMPFFLTDGKILCFMAAFKAHAGFGFWRRGKTAILGEAPAKAGEAMGSSAGSRASTASRPTRRSAAGSAGRRA